MRNVMAALMASLLLVGCTTRYVVEAGALEEARSADLRSVAVRTTDGTATWLLLDSIDEERQLSATDTEVTARDPGPALRWSGWLALGAGALLLAGGLSMIDLESRPATFDDAVDGAMGGIVLTGVGALGALTGIGLLIPGYLTSGPELPAPPAASAVAPAR